MDIQAMRTMRTMQYCPACYQPGGLIALGARHDRLHRWRWWITTITQIYLCARCDALVQVRATETGGDHLIISGSDRSSTSAGTHALGAKGGTSGVFATTFLTMTCVSMES